MPDRPFTADDLDIRDVVISRSQMRDFQLYERLKSEAERRGTRLQILSDAEYDKVMNQDDGVSKAPHQPTARMPTPKEPQGVYKDERGIRHLVISRDQARNFETYLALRQQAAEMGMDVLISPDDAA